MNNSDKKNSLFIILSSITSRLGNSVFDYANQMMISSLFPKEPMFLAIYQSSENIISILLNLFAGAVADNSNRKKILIITDFLSGIVCLIGFFFLKSSLIYFALVIGNILLAILSSFNSPFYNAIVKESISKDYIKTHMSLFSLFKESISVISPVVGIFIWRYFGIEIAYIFNSITFFFSAFISSRITIIDKVNLKNDKKENIFLQIKEGIDYILKNNAIKNLLFISMLVNFFLSAYNLLLPYLTNYYKEFISDFYGKALISQSIGAIIFSYINTKFLKSDNENYEKRLRIYIFFTGLFIFLIPIIDKLKIIYLNLLLYLLFGGVLTLFNIEFFTLIQLIVDKEYTGRVFSVIFTVAIFFMPLGSLVFGKLLNIENLNGFYISGIGIMLAIFLNLKNKD